MSKCQECNGTGKKRWKHRESRLHSSGAVTRCPVCNGTGRTADAPGKVYEIWEGDHWEFVSSWDDYDKARQECDRLNREFNRDYFLQKNTPEGKLRPRRM